MGTLDGAILVGGIGTSGIHSVVEFLKKGNNERVFVKFTALVKDDVFVVDVRRVLGEPGVEPVEGGTLGDTGGSGKV